MPWELRTKIIGKMGKNYLIYKREKRVGKMDERELKFERTRAYWWSIYCKCRPIQKKFEDKTGNNEKELVAEMKDLKAPCEVASGIMKEFLWAYLKNCKGEKQLLKISTGLGEGIKITSVWLWAYFGYLFLTSKTFSRYQSLEHEKPEFTPQEKLEFYYRLSTFFLQLLNEIRGETDKSNQSSFRLEGLEGITYVQFARSLIYLISEYCHMEVKMSRVFDVESVLHKTILSDAYLYLTKERYRDHMFHVIDVCLLGFFLLDCHFQNQTHPLTGINPKEQSLMSLISKIIFGGATDGINHTMQNWFLAALFHDVGYSLQAEDQSREEFQKKMGEKELNIEEWQKVMEKDKLKIHRKNLAELERRKAQYGDHFPLYMLNQIESEKEAISQSESKLESWKTGTPHPSTIEPSPFNEETKEDHWEDHGVRSYLYVKSVLETLPEENEKLLKEFKPALAAIKKHNLMTEKINFAEEPLSFLLVLCDELQEWGRARVDITELRETMISKINFPDTDILPVNSLLNYLHLGVDLDEEKKCGKLPGKRFDFCLFYKDATKENFEPLAIWLLKSYNFQRLMLQGNIFEINVNLCHPVCKELRDLDIQGVCEHSLLRDFMRDRRKWWELQDWLENNSQVKWATYHPTGAEDKIDAEHITMDLNKFSEKPVLHDNPINIFKELFQWRQDFINGKRRKL